MYDQEWDATEYYEEPEQQVDPRLESAVYFVEQQQAVAQQEGAEAAYESEMDRLVAQHPGLRPELMHPFVVTADGDFNQAYQLYENYVDATRQAYAPVEYEAPPEPSNIHEAVDSLVANLKANRR